MRLIAQFLIDGARDRFGESTETFYFSISSNVIKRTFIHTRIHASVGIDIQFMDIGGLYHVVF